MEIHAFQHEPAYRDAIIHGGTAMTHYEIVKQNIGNAELCIVSKHRTVGQAMAFYDLGERIFAENRAQELIEKALQMPADIRWQYIGHLQRNKVRAVLPYISCVQSLDSLQLAETIERECIRIGKTVDALLEVHLALQDTNKTGMTADEAYELLQNAERFPHIQMKGLMVMGPHTDDEDAVRAVFLKANELFKDMQKQYPPFQTLSMGMSSDYKIAVECGSTMVRIGTYLFTEEE